MVYQRMFTDCVLGLSLAALAIWPSTSFGEPSSIYEFDYDFVVPSAKATMGKGIDARTGTFKYSHKDIDIGMAGSTLEIRRLYNSDHRSNPVASFGPGYQHNFDAYLVSHYFVRCNPGGPVVHCLPERHVTVNIGGRAVWFTPNSPSPGYLNSTYDGSELEESTVYYGGKQHTVFVFTDKRNGIRAHFDTTDWSWDCNAEYRVGIAPPGCTRASHIEKSDGSFVALKNERTSNNIVRLKEVVNERGYGLQFTYLSNSHLISRIDGFRVGCQTTGHLNCGAGQYPQATYTYVGGKLSQYSNGVGGARYYDYNSDDLLVAERTSDAPGVKLFENTYDPGITLTSDSNDIWYPVLTQSDDRGNDWTFYYAYPGSDLDAGGTWVQYTYSKQTDPQGGITEFYFDQDEDGAGGPLFDGTMAKPIHSTMPTRVVDPSGVQTSYKHHRYGNHPPKEVVYASGAKTLFENVGALIRRVAAPVSGLADQVVATQWHICSGGWRDCARKPSKVTDARGGETDYQYDSVHGGLTAILLPPDAAGQRSLITRTYGAFYPAAGVTPGLPWIAIGPTYRVTKSVRCLGAATSITSSCPMSQQVSETKVYRASSSGSRTSHELEDVVIDQGGLSIASSYGYDKVGNVISEDGPLVIDDVVTITYDRQRRLTRKVTPKADSASLHLATLYYYNGKGQLTRTAQGTQTSRTGGYSHLRASCSTYDAAGRMISSKGFGASSSSTQCPSSADNATAYTTFTYDSLGREDIVEQILGSGQGPNRKTKTTYYANGLTHKVIRAYGTSLQQDYKTYTYNANNQVATIADAKGNLTSYGYDGHDRLATTSFADGSLESYGYDPSNNRISKTVRDGRTILYTYDPRNQLVSKNVPGAIAGDPTLYTYTYDLAGRKKTDSYWSFTQQYTYDKAGRLLQKTHNGTTMPVSFLYDKASNVTRLTYPDGWQVNYTYDALGRVTQAKEGTAPANEQPNRVIAFVAYDDLSRRQSISLGNGVQSSYTHTPGGDLLDHSLIFANSETVNFGYTYNKVSQISSMSVTDPSLHWMPAGDEPVEFFQSNTLNQYTQAKGLSLSYDANGNLINAGNGWTYKYDADNGLSRAYQSGSTVAHYVHYADGNRRYKWANGTVGRFYYSGNQEIYETGSSTSDKRSRYVRLPGIIDEAILMLDYKTSQTSPKNVWAHWDRSGSTIATSDASGVSNEKIAYSPYGESTVESEFPFQYTGQKFDSETGLYYYKARYYNPELGRFLQTDPVGYEDQMNLYAYAGNDPLNATDPDGNIFKLIKAGYNVVKRTYKNGGNIKGALKDELLSIADNVSTLADGQLTIDDAFAVIDLATGFGGEAKTLTRKVCCFVAGTLVDTANGLKPIEQIEIGDMVWARDAESGVTGLKPVTDLIRRNQRQIWIVEFLSDDGELARFETTDDHPWWIPGAGWLRTDQLRPGLIATTLDEDPASISRVERTERVDATYNLTVADFNTYFVGELQVLVHNCDPKGANSSANAARLEKQLASEEQLGQLSRGGGTVISQPAKAADRVAAQTGRNSADIQKVSSDVRVTRDGQHVETHAFRDATTNELIEPKTIIHSRQ